MIPITAYGAACTVEIAGAASADAWDRVAAGEGGTFSHLWAWRDILAEELRAEPFYLAARDRTGELAGILPLAHVRSRLFGSYLVSLPFLNDGGPVGREEAARPLIRTAVAEAGRRQADLLELRTRHPLAGGLRVSDRKITVMLDLPDEPQVLWKDGLSSKLRSQIRRPLKAGLEVRYGNDQVDAFYHVFERTMTRLGTPVLPRSFFRRVAADLHELAVVGVVYHAGRPAAAGFGFAHRGEVEITWAGFLREHSREAPNMLLYWSFMERAMERGARVFNFGRCTPGSGSHRFKAQWGGRDVPLPWLQWSPGGVTSPPDPDSRLYRIARRVWSHLPVSVNRRIGPMLVRRLP